MTRRDELPPIEELPIPADAAVGKGWTGQMVEMADHIGAVATLKIVAAFGGEEIYIAIDAARNCLGPVIGEKLAVVMSQVYGRERLRVPVARNALMFARRQPIIAAVRAGHMTVSDAARTLRSTPNFVSHLVNQTNEGTAAVLPPRSFGRSNQLTCQLDLFPAGELSSQANES